MLSGLQEWPKRGRYEVFSAGTRPSHVRTEAIEVMQELGIDISSHRSKSVDKFAAQQFDYIITVCDNAKENCPIFPGRNERVQWNIEGPAATQGSVEERQAVFRRIRDEIAGRIRLFAAKRS